MHDSDNKASASAPGVRSAMTAADGKSVDSRPSRQPQVNVVCGLELELSPTTNCSIGEVAADPLTQQTNQPHALGGCWKLSFRSETP